MTRTVTTAIVLGFAAAAALAAWHLGGVGNDLGLAAAANPGKSYAGTRAAPEFPTGMDWINSGGETLTLARLKGKVVLLDFWTYGCANCMHVIPDLKRLEQKYPRELVVIGVHSAKFANEGRTSQIRKIVQRYELQHPVVNDQYMRIWNAFGVNAWPTIAVIDPAGNAVGQVAGEGHYDVLDTVVGALVEEFRARRQLDETPFAYRPDALPNTVLRFPGKLLADAAGGRLFISDSNHDRIVVTDLAGKVQKVIGGARGFADGEGFAADGARAGAKPPAARFHQPQGLALADADTLFVADNLNNAIRRVDLRTGAVTTVAGDGQHGYMRDDRYATPRTARLNSPWDLAWVGDGQVGGKSGQLYIAMAGQHQLWSYDPRTAMLTRFAGSGYEALEDGPLLDAGMTQPSGLSSDGTRLFIADAEASAVRTADLGPGGRLTTLIGTGLFDFGDADGVGSAVKLQHALGVAWVADKTGGKVFVTDTYNSKLKVLDPQRRSVTTLADGFDEPGGLSVAGGKVYIADTNHHAIKVYDIASKQVSELALRFE
jgi:thiol-disulfide isomerase/thioredoxin